MATTVFLVLCVLAALSFVPRFRRGLIELLDRVGDSVLLTFEFFYQRHLKTVYGVLACCVIGLFIATPILMHGGFSASSRDTGAESAAYEATEPSPGAMPPLEYQIDVADCILLAETRIDNNIISFEPQDFWKAPEDCASNSGDAALKPDISSFRLLGYKPKQGQLAVLFFTPGRDQAPQLIELLPVASGHLTYAPDDSSVKRQLDLGAMRQLVTGPVSAAH